MIGRTISHYEIRDQLGQGGMGIVYRAFDTKLEREVALKFLPPELSADEDSKARFIQEAKAASALDHPNICTIHEIGESDDGKLYIVMSYYDGQTLKYLLQEGAMAVDRAVDIMSQIAAGLRKAHDAGIVHRDIKPANIMVTDDGLVKILDFGLAKLGQGADLTKAGSTVGTTAYMSPEQSSGSDVDGRTDLWSVGVILYELLSGTRAFGGGYDQAVLYSVLNEDPEPLSDVPKELVSIVSKLIAKKPDDRFTDASALYRAFEGYSSGVRPIDPIDTVKSVRNAVPMWKYVGIGILCILIPVFFYFSSGSESGPVAEPAGMDENMIAVLPFTIQGSPDMEYLSTSMVTILSTMLDGTGPLKTVDHATVLEAIGPDDSPSIGPSAGLRLATDLGAGRFILGNIVRAGNQNRISARLYESDGSSSEESIAVYTGDDDFMGAVNTLAAGLIGGILANPDREIASIEAATTNSFPALKHYLTGEEYTREGRHREAYDEANLALNIDSTFALAWLLRSHAIGWLNVVSGSARADLNQAIRYKDQLTGRVRRLLDGQKAFDEGHAIESEQIFRAILKDYPTSIEATGQLAEVLVHYSERESRMKEALRLIERLNELSPGNQNFASHHISLVAIRARINNDYYVLDSLAAAFAGMAIPERGEELDWSVALDQMNENSRISASIYATVAGSPEDSAATYGKSGGRFDPDFLLNNGYPEQAELLLQSRGHHPEYPFSLTKTIAMTRGKLSAASAISASHRWDLPATDIVQDVLHGTLPAFGTTEEKLVTLRSRVERWNVDADSIFLYSQDGEKIRQYLLATIAFASGDDVLFAEHHATYFQIVASDPDYPTWKSINYELLGLAAWRQGDLDQAIEQMHFARIRGMYFIDASIDLLSIRFQPNWYLAEIYEESGDIENAIDWFTSGYKNAEFQAPGWERTAQLYDQIGNAEEAIRYYGLLISHWKEADEVLQPRVEAARDRIDELLADLAREPQ